MFQVLGRRAASLRIGRYTNFLDTTPARVVLTFARARFDSNENQDGEFLSFAV